MVTDSALLRAFRAYDAEQKAAQARVAQLSELKAELLNQLWLNRGERTQADVARMVGLTKARVSQILDKVNPPVHPDAADDWAIIDD